MARLALPLALCLAAMVATASAAVGAASGPTLNRPTTYTSLAPVGGQWDIDLEATKGTASKALFLPQVCASPAVDAPCNQPLLTAERQDRVRITARLNSTVLKTNGGLAPQQVVIRLCYSKPSSADRPWRKGADAIDMDKSCPPFGAVAKLPIAANGTYTAVWKVPKGAPLASFYAQVLVSCKNGTLGDYFCQYDSTMGKNFVATKIINSTPSSLIAAVTVCSAIAPVFLLAFFVKEQMIKKAN